MIPDLLTLPPDERQYYLEHVTGPRPIGFISTIDKAGTAHLSPFSFFNVFSSDPPIVIFSVVRRPGDNSANPTMTNIAEVPEAVVNIISYPMVQQAVLASGAYAHDEDEFLKAGFVKQPARYVRPPMVAMSPAKIECRILEVKSPGGSGSAAALVIAEAVCLHLPTAMLHDGKIDVSKMDLVARMGDNLYARVNAGLFEVNKTGRYPGIGMNRLPACIRTSSRLTDNQKAQLAGLAVLPEPDPDFRDERVEAFHVYIKDERKREMIFQYAADLLDADNINHAWQVLLTLDEMAMPAGAPAALQV